MQSAINSTSASSDASPMISALNWKCSRRRAALLFFVAKTLRDREPFERFLEFAVVRRHDARERRRELGPHRDFALAFVGEIEKLAHDLRAAFLCVKLGRLENRPVPFHETVAARDFAPFREDVISAAQSSGRKSRKPGSGCISRHSSKDDYAHRQPPFPEHEIARCALNKLQLRAVG